MLSHRPHSHVSTLVPLLVVLGAVSLPCARGFGIYHCPSISQTAHTSQQHYAVPEVIMESLPAIQMGAVAAASAAAGALSQQPQIQQLQKELKLAEEQLEETQAELEEKMEHLQDKLFLMDQEYEEQTARFKRQYDDKLKVELEQMTEKIKIDYQYQLEIKLEQDRSAKLTEQLEDVNGLTDRQAALNELHREKNQMAETNRQLEQALLDSDKELERLHQAIEDRKKSNPLFGWLSR